MLARLDHLAFRVSDVFATRASLVELGFDAGVLGQCRWRERGTERSARCLSIVFAEQYLDFIESAAGRIPQRPAGLDLYARGIVPSGVVLRADSVQGAVQHLRSIGIEPHAPYEIERQLAAQPAKTVRYRFLGLPRAATELPIGIIEDPDPAALRGAGTPAHPNGATGVVGVHLRVRDHHAAAGWLRLLTGNSIVGGAHGTATVALGGVRFQFHRDPTLDWLGELGALLPSDVPVALLAVEFAVTDLRVPTERLLESGVSCRALGARLVVAPAGGYGCGIVFTSTQVAVQTAT